MKLDESLARNTAALPMWPHFLESLRESYSSHEVLEARV